MSQQTDNQILLKELKKAHDLFAALGFDGKYPCSNSVFQTKAHKKSQLAQYVSENEQTFSSELGSKKTKSDTPSLTHG